MRVPRDWREIFERPAHPYAPALISAIPDPLRRAPLATTGGDLPNPLSPPDGCAFSPRCRYAEAEGDLSERCRYFALGPTERTRLRGSALRAWRGSWQRRRMHLR